MRNNWARLGGYLTHLDVTVMSNLFSFSNFHFVFTYMIKSDDALTEIQFSQPDKTVMGMHIYQFKLNFSFYIKLVFIKWL